MDALFAAPAPPKPPRKERKGLRLCVVTKQYRPKAELMRVVRIRRDNDKYTVKLNEANGRSAYLSKTREAVAAAQKKNFLARVLKCQISKDVFDEMLKVVQRAEEEAADRISMEDRDKADCENASVSPDDDHEQDRLTNS
mmetsp:Transcript_1227/g.3791  ORF Transcript_1227/g.3791 Transcript_1227/m.3791 type:complete len:140 (-) Transcript_1227:1318-1737(-)|eukprot:CAMPEP_0198732338 /NCGR_PEP_ID=MMETSP1475-20131203/35129_1 /TAXON_ID= ORGANISM="Unidentified sp., Strain CCMP1999" /NCGR_SAMPLE_ID=MMETSP1475 /ASSEMBLY_ACC=CAM_ASM_001111 /LENGTH=139 /DNA_ID=CAMNT_0044495419 /DNA_START=74 /DNA_END=493 /DNA_ORIENTATION=-